MFVSRHRLVRCSLSLCTALVLPLIAACQQPGADSHGDAGPAASPRSGASSAATVPAATSAATSHVARIGAITVTTVSDGYAERPVEGFVRNASLDAVGSALAAAGLPTDKVRLPFTAVVVEHDGRRILFDGGNGEFGAASSGRLLANLASAGIEPAQIDDVVISHFHVDHINGLRSKAGVLTFPNARLHVPAIEWAFWTDEARISAAPEAMKPAFANVTRVFAPIADKVHRFYSGAEVVPGVRSVLAAGHTPGHTVFTIESGAATWAYLADTTNIPLLFARNPDWAVVFDMDAEMARKTRRDLFEQAVDEKWFVSGYHFPFPALGQMVRRGDGFDFQPMR